MTAKHTAKATQDLLKALELTNTGFQLLRTKLKAKDFFVIVMHLDKGVSSQDAD